MAEEKIEKKSAPKKVVFTYMNYMYSMGEAFSKWEEMAM